ncbi:MAG: hypothetical protein GY876_09790 [Planctomycetes bacterium]|jgi:hypothetical protein|nr:hypothetical protein [Planctomycetota bacterium]
MTNRTTHQFAIVALAVTVLVLMSDRLMVQAGAEDETKAPAMGPASQLTLENEDAETITLKVEEKRIAWGDEPQMRIRSVAYVHIGKALAALMKGDSFVEEQQALADEMKEAQQAIAETFEVMQEKMQGITPDDPDFESINMEAQAVLQQRDRFMQQANVAKATLGAEQVERAYRELVDAVNVVADRLEIDTVHRFIPTDDSFEIQPSPGAFQAAMLQIRLRSVLRYPEDIDITGEVLEELGIE